MQFTEIITPSVTRRHRRWQRRLRRMSIWAISCFVLAVICLSILIVIAILAVPGSARIRTEIREDPFRAMKLMAADSYNARLLKNGALAYGDAPSPVGDGQRPASDGDEVYNGTLDGPYGVMGALRIPSIGADMDIRHGTLDAALNQGAGHFYGTMLPTGSEGTAVIGAHRGLGSRLLFIRARELETGGMIYTETFGRSTAWSVTGTAVVAPGTDEERSAITPVPSKSLLALYTCDPVGLNTNASSLPPRWSPPTPRTGASRTPIPG
jgi:sortase A